MPPERTLVVIKPDGMAQKSRIISYYTKAGLKIAAQKQVQIAEKQAGEHYAATSGQILGMGNKTIEASARAGSLEKMKKIFGTDDPEKIGMKLREWLVKFIASAPVMAYVLEGEGAVALARKVTGFTDPAYAENGTVRGDMGTDSIVKANSEGRPVRNVVHASGSAEEAEKEIKLWFPEL